MEIKNNCKTLFYLLYSIVGVFFISAIQSCGKAVNASPQGLNISYQVINLSLSPVYDGIFLFIDFKEVNASPFLFNNAPSYFFVPTTDTPYQFRQALVTGASGPTIFSRSDILTVNAKYTLYLSGTQGTNTFNQLFTVDTASLPPVGRGKVRFVNISPTANTGLDVVANGTIAFKAVAYPTASPYVELPVGDYNFQINTANTANVIQQLTEKIEDGRLYTIYAYGYTSRTDSAEFNVGFITNK
jgi:hypothetical protein